MRPPSFNGHTSLFFQYLTTVNHKLIGVVYAATGILFGLSGWILSLIIRHELAKPVAFIIQHDTPEIYNMVITLHGITMIFFMVMPNLFGGQGNIWMPLTVGSCEVAYPKINNGSLMVLLTSYACAVSAITGEFLNGLGWVMYAPLSTAQMSLSSVTMVALGGALLVNGTSSTLTSTNYLGTLCFTKVNTLTLVLYAVTICVAAFLLLGSLPSLTGGLLMLISDTKQATTYFAAEAGGDVVMWQHLFWIFGHPEVYVLILPALGIAALVISSQTGGTILGATGMMAGTIGIAVLGFCVWAHHMLAVGLDTDTSALFSMLTLSIAVPTGVKVLHLAGSYAAASHANPTH